MINAIYNGRPTKNFEPDIHYEITVNLTTAKLVLDESSVITTIPVVQVIDNTTVEMLAYTSLEQFLNEWTIMK